MIVGPLAALFTGPGTGSRPVALRGGNPVDFAEFRADVARVAHAFSGCPRAALFCRDSYVFAVGLFGLLHAGAKVILPPNGQPGLLAALSDRFDRLIGDDLLERAGGAGADLDSLPTGEPLLHFFTSGSTGEAKCVVKSLGMMEQELHVLESLWPAGDGPVLSTVSHQHLYGLTFRILLPLAVGRPFTAETHELWETLLAVLPAGAVVVSSPAHLGRTGGLAPVPPARRPACVMSAGAPLSAVAARQSAAILGPLPTEIFGSTETGVIATRRQERGDEDWSLLPGVEMRTEADGRLSLRAPHMGSGWVATGDQVAPVPGGFRFQGRMDRIVKIEGKRIDLKDVEQALLRLPWVAAAAVALLPGDPARLAAAVVPSPAGAERLAQLGSFRFGRLLRRDLSDTQEPAGMPRMWRFVPALPDADMGKRRRADIQALFGDRG
ncbi:AMP-binding protein [Telmatospirillum siberiense]|uniref:AMP-dependent synthetase/ligase domain-containing protein n=1 Tax=Telmatospirillum siberiense TaxID=382514 RepID=A0A2N3PW05_9PROT|nr:AMP-binding protein [Telmatospirillum siberiense]PKU24592.1 hypothetical protein CWS72_10860 [Telmatospirillum siberiense]